MVKHDFLNLKSCNDDKEWLTKNVTGGQRDQCEAAWTKIKTHARCRTVDRKRVLACRVFTDRHQRYCKRKTGFHCLRIQKKLVKTRNKTAKQGALSAGKP